MQPAGLIPCLCLAVLPLSPYDGPHDAQEDSTPTCFLDRRLASPWLASWCWLAADRWCLAPQRAAACALRSPCPPQPPEPPPALTVAPAIVFPTPTPTPDPYAGVTIADLAARSYGDGEFRIEQVLAATDAFTRTLVSYDSDGLTVYGFMNVPFGLGPFPVDPRESRLRRPGHLPDAHLHHALCRCAGTGRLRGHPPQLPGLPAVGRRCPTSSAPASRRTC